MSLFVILALLFLLVMSSVSFAGYRLFYREPASPIAPGDRVKHVLSRVGESVPTKQSNSLDIQRQLILAGYRQPGAQQIFSGLKLGLAVVTALAVAGGTLIAGREAAAMLIATLAAAVIAYRLPDLILKRAIDRRARRILNGIPTLIDLLILSLEAGQSLDSALLDAARELEPTYPELCAELKTAQMELLASRGRPEVFRALRDRNTEPELKRLAQVFIDSDRFGTSLAPALRTHVKFLRQRLRQQAQEQARKVTVKLVFPVFFLIFPAVILVTLGPAIIQVYSQLGAMMSK